MREMKDSSVEWIGEIPAHWSPIRFRFVAKITTGNQDTQNADPDGEYPFYVRSPIVERCNNYTFDGKGILMAGDGAGAGRVFHLVDGKYAVHQRVYRFYDFKYMDPVLLKYYLENLFATVMDYGSAKTTVPSVRLPMIQDFVVCVPPKKEQDNTVAVLNEKCAQVGSLISNVQAQIEKLKAYKQSLITEVVTKGLDPTVPMKDSGLEWIGKIPAHWEITRKLAFVTTEGISYGIVKLFDPDDVNGVKVLRCSDVLEGWIKPDNIRTVMQEVSNEYARTILSGGEVVVNVRGSLGGCAVVPKTMAGYNIAREVAKIALNDSMCNRYVMYYLLSRCFVEYRTSRLSGSVYVGLNIELLSSCPLPNPDLAEQTAIADYLDEKCSQIDRLIAIKQAKIEKLEQYKRSLIYECVTGKREVV